MSFTQTWVIEGDTYPSEPIPLERCHSEFQRPFSVAYFCPFCGTIWARRIVTGGGIDREWNLWHRPCSKHPNSISRGISGSVYLGWNSDADRYLPKAVLRREVLLHIGAENSQLSEPINVSHTQAIPPQAAVQQQDSSAEQQAQRLVSARQRFQIS